jgi:pyruvate-formate lyase
MQAAMISEKGMSARTIPPPSDMLVPTTSTRDPFVAELRFTAVHRAYRDAHPALREAACLAVQLPETLAPIQDGDLFAGRLAPRLCGFTPDEWGAGITLGYHIVPRLVADALASHEVTPERRAQVAEMVQYWRSERTAAKVRAAYPPALAEALPSDGWMAEPGIAFPLYRLCGGTVQNGRLIKLGLPGLRAAVAARRAHGDVDLDLLTGFDRALDMLEDAASRYREHALALAVTSPPARRLELEQLAVTLAMICERAPETYREAVQLFWLYQLCGDIRNYGRLDVALGPLLAHDLDTGVLSEEDALRLTQSLWRLMAARLTRVHNRVVIGGKGRLDEKAADRFALLAIEASRTVLEAEPQLSLRFYLGQDPRLLERGLDSIAEGRTFPILYNDKVNIPAAASAMGVSRPDAEQYVPYGCGELILDGGSFATPSGVLNLLKALEAALFHGVCQRTGRRIGPDLGGLETYRSFDDLWAAYTGQVDRLVCRLAEQERLEYDVCAREFSALYLSLLYDGCLERGRAFHDGGLERLAGTLETYGNTNTADSLLAIRRLVFERQTVSPEELLAALRNDFAQAEPLRRLLLSQPKYGNDNDEADAMLVRVHEHVCGQARAQAARVGLASYLVVVINNSANTLMGAHTAASADGRHDGTPMANGNAPTGGADVSGLTARMNSIVRPSPKIHDGTVQNLSLSRELFRDHRAEVEALLAVYFARGGTQLMVTVTGRGELEAALAHPDEYRHVFVRVGGFSARFVDLPEGVQREIIERTLY